jgi:hypothetical protein
MDKLTPDERLHLDSHNNQVAMHAFYRCQDALLNIVIGHMWPMAGSQFDEIDTLINEFEQKVKGLEFNARKPNQVR